MEGVKAKGAAAFKAAYLDVRLELERSVLRATRRFERVTGTTLSVEIRYERLSGPVGYEIEAQIAMFQIAMREKA